MTTEVHISCRAVAARGLCIAEAQVCLPSNNQMVVERSGDCKNDRQYNLFDSKP